MFGDLSSNEIENVLSNHILGRVGCHADNTTYIVPMSYAYDGAYVYGLSREGMKLDMMRKNPAVCFEVEDTENMGNWKSVIAWGDFEELTNTEERNNALQHLVKRALPMRSSSTTHLSDEWPFQPEHIEHIKGVVFRIRLHTKTGRYEKNMATTFLA